VNSNRFPNAAGADGFFAGPADKVTDLSALDQAFLFGL